MHEAAERHGIEVRTPENFRAAADREAFAALKLDVAVVVAYGLLLPQSILDAPRLGCFNLHGSILPRWRGAAPIHRAVMAGDTITGVQVMKMEAGLDTGPVMKTATTPITEDDTTGDVHDRLSLLGADLMVKALAELEAGPVTLTPQTEDGVTIAAKVSPAEARIDWTQAGEGRGRAHPGPVAVTRARGSSSTASASARCTRKPNPARASRAKCSTTCCWSPAARARCASPACRGRGRGR